MDSKLIFRLATQADLKAIIQMLSDDVLGASRENPSTEMAQKYLDAFIRISQDPNQELTVVEMNSEIVATFHLSFLQYLTHSGGLRAQIEAVRTHRNFRGRGIGKQVFEYAIQRAKDNGCIMVQLTTDKQRPDAIRFYESIGFVATHEGMKMRIL